MALWLAFCRFVVAHQYWLGWPIFVAAILSIILPPVIAKSKHARAQAKRVPVMPTWPSDHMRFWGYAFSRSTWTETSGWDRVLVLLFRIAVLVAIPAAILLFVTSVSLGDAQPGLSCSSRTEPCGAEIRHRTAGQPPSPMLAKASRLGGAKREFS